MDACVTDEVLVSSHVLLCVFGSRTTATTDTNTPGSQDPQKAWGHPERVRNRPALEPAVRVSARSNGVHATCIGIGHGRPYHPTATGNPTTAVGYPATAVGYPPTGRCTKSPKRKQICARWWLKGNRRRLEGNRWQLGGNRRRLEGDRRIGGEPTAVGGDDQLRLGVIDGRWGNILSTPFCQKIRVMCPP